MKDKNGHTLTIAVWFPAARAIISQLHPCPLLLHCRDTKRAHHECQTPSLKQVLCQVQSEEGSGEKREGERREATVHFLLLDGVLQHAASVE